MARTKKRKLIWISILILLFAALVFIRYWQKSQTSEPVQSPTDQSAVTPETAKITITAKDVAQKEDKPTYSVDVVYPKVSGISATASASVSNDIAKEVTQIISDFKTGSADAIDTSEQSTLGINYKITPPAHGVFGVALDVSDYNAGAAHPNTYIVALNYSTTSGVRITLADLFQSGVGYLNVLSKSVTTKLNTRFNTNWFAEGAQAKEENYQNFKLSDSSLTILFNPYQVQAYAAGVVEVAIPLSELTPYLKSEFTN